MPATIHSPVNTEERKKADIRPGDTVRVWQKVEEKNKTRLQKFEGLVIARKHGTEPGATFTVRRVSSGVGVERIFPLYSPIIDKIEVLKRAKVRRGKLYYIRDKASREVRRKMKQLKFTPEVYGTEPVASAEEETEEEVKDNGNGETNRGEETQGTEQNDAESTEEETHTEQQEEGESEETKKE